MAGLSNYEKAVLVLTAGFVAFTGAWFWGQNRTQGEIQVTTLPRQQQELVRETGEDEEDGWPDSLLPGETIDLNTAGIEELDQLPGIGEVLAGRIIAYREANGPFESTEELLEVSGIGEARLAELEGWITVGAPEDGAETSTKE